MGRGILIDFVLVRFCVIMALRTSYLLRIIEQSRCIPYHSFFGLFPSSRVSKTLRTGQVMCV